MIKNCVKYDGTRIGEIALKKILNLSFLYIFFILILSSSLCAKPQTKTQDQQTVTIIKIIDGDTLKIKYQGKDENVRLIGIDTPESKANKKAENDSKRSGQDIRTITALGKEATNYVKSLVKPGNTVRIEFDVQQRDRYGRLLGYIYLDNGKMLNEEVTRAGYATIMTVPPNVKYSERFLKAFREARENKRGLWK